MSVFWLATASTYRHPHIPGRQSSARVIVLSIPLPERYFEAVSIDCSSPSWMDIISFSSTVLIPLQAPLYFLINDSIPRGWLLRLQPHLIYWLLESPVT